MNNKVNDGKKIVRILGHGQFAIDNNTLNEINTIDNNIVKLLENETNDDLIKTEFENQLNFLNTIIEEKGKPIEPKEILQSDVVIPGKDISINTARKLFKGEGIIRDMD